MADAELKAAERRLARDPDDEEALAALLVAWVRAGKPATGAIGAPAARWAKEGRAFAEAIDALVEQGRRDGWESVGEEPEDPRADLAPFVLRLLRAGRGRPGRAPPPDRAGPRAVPGPSRAEGAGGRAAAPRRRPDRRPRRRPTSR